MGELLVLLFAVGCGIALLRLIGRRRRRWRRYYRELARHFRGRSSGGGLLSGFPRSEFAYGEARIVIGAESGCRVVSGLFDWPADGSWCVVRSASSGVPAWRSFEQRYSISNQVPDAPLRLTDGVRWQIDRLRAWQKNDDVEIVFSSGRVSVRKRAVLERAEQLVEFTDLVLALYDQLQLSRGEAIAFVDAPLAQPLDEAVCKVCGEPIVTDMVFCRRCKTPHHEECWDYNGACSTYGCQEITCVTPQLARLSNDDDDVERDVRSHPKPR